jgi:hypothetical protein
MTDLWFKTKDAMKTMYEGQRYSDAIEILRKIASGELTYIQIVTEAKCFFDKYSKKEK